MNWIYIVILFSIQQSGSRKGSAMENVALPKAVYTYQEHILPILKSNCGPCHFHGGKVYDKYPFDSYETVSSLGLKLNTRLKDKEKDVVIRWVQSGKVEPSYAPR